MLLNTLALLLVLASSLLHATWNLLAKRTKGGASLVWLYDILSILFYAPLVIVLIIVQHIHLNLIFLGLMFVSGLIHLAYFLTLQRGYRVGDLSLVYPLARGTGPLLATIAAIVLLGERPTLFAIAGMLLVVSGVFLIAGGLRLFAKTHNRQGILYALLVGVFIAIYTIWDKRSVSIYLVPPIIYFYGIIIVDAVLLTPYAVRHWMDVRTEWQTHRLEVSGIALMSPASYFLVLTALVFTGVSYVAPFRESSVLLGTLMGTHLLSEESGRARIIGACVLLAGIIALAI